MLEAVTPLICCCFFGDRDLLVELFVRVLFFPVFFVYLVGLTFLFKDRFAIKDRYVVFHDIDSLSNLMTEFLISDSFMVECCCSNPLFCLDFPNIKFLITCWIYFTGRSRPAPRPAPARSPPPQKGSYLFL